MGIKRFFKNKIRDYQFIKNKRKVSVDLHSLDYFKNYSFNFSEESNPEVSVIIYEADDLKMLLHCLFYISKFDENIGCEVIVSGPVKDEIMGNLNTIAGLKIVAQTGEQSSVQAVNEAISAAKGKFIYLLDAHNIVQEKYLSTLIELMNSKENIGAVGSKIISAENTIIEAGNLVTENSEINKIGQNAAIDTPKFNFVRKVDCCSGSLLFKKFNKNGELHILDDSFSEMYFAVADLCLKLKEANLEVYYHPFSEVVNFKNSSISVKKLGKATATSSIYKAPTVLFLEENMPKPDQDSGSRRFLEIVKILQKNHHRLVLAIKHFDKEKDSDYISFFQKAGVQICMNYVNSQNKIIKVDEQVIESLSYVDVIWIFRPIGFEYWYSLIKNKVQGKKLIYDMVDLHYLRMERENNYIDNVTKEREKEIQFFRDKEYFGMNTADAVISISDEEKNTVSQNGVKKDKIFTVSNIHQPVVSQSLPFSEREGLLFIGGYNHLPNIDAVKFLHGQIMPLVWKKNAQIKIYILGPDFPADLKAQYHSEKFQILGYQETVDFWFENSRVFVAPLRYGAGVKGKIGQALEFKLPVVTTGIGAEGMSLQDRKTALISDENPQHFAEKIIELYGNEDLWNTLHANSLLPLSKFSVETQEENINKMFQYLSFSKD